MSPQEAGIHTAKLRFKLPYVTKQALTYRLPDKRRQRRVKAALQAIGTACAQLLTDGYFDCAMLRGLQLATRWQIVERWLAEMTAIGIVEVVAEGWYRIRDFAACNKSQADHAAFMQNLHDKKVAYLYTIADGQKPWHSAGRANILEDRPRSERLSGSLREPNVRGSIEPRKESTPPANPAPASYDDSFEARCERMRQHQASQQQDPIPCRESAAEAPPAPPAPLQQQPDSWAATRAEKPRHPRHPNAAKHAAKKAAKVSLKVKATEQDAQELLLAGGCGAEDVHDLIPATHAALAECDVRQGEVEYAVDTLKAMKFSPGCRPAYLLGILNGQRKKRAVAGFKPFKLPRQAFLRAVHNGGASTSCQRAKAAA